MKKSISVFICLILILSSFSFAFAVDWTNTDSSNLASIKTAVNSGGGLYGLVSTISSRLQYSNITVGQMIYDIRSYLQYGQQTISQIAYNSYSYLTNIHQTLLNNNSWLSNIGQNISNIILDLDSLKYGLLRDLGNNTSSAYLDELDKSLTNYFINGNISNANAQLNAHRQMVDSNWMYTLPNFSSADFTVDSNGYNIDWRYGSPLGNIALILRHFDRQMVISNSAFFRAFITGYNNTQTFSNWETLSSSSFTPTSGVNGIYTWLQNIQAPVARLSYVLASNERIEAQEAAAANEEAVVDNFIDSSGSGAASTSDFDSIADFSSGYKSTFASDASPTGIFDLFNSSNMGWFSQETANQLDTTSNNRAKSDNTFNTPLLDQQINSIYEQLGVKQP